MPLLPNYRAVKRHILGLVGLSLVLAALGGCGTGAAQDASMMMPPPDVSVATVALQDVVFWDTFTGRVEAVETVELRPRVSGYIDRVNYVEGGQVQKGDVLFVIDQRTYRAALARAEAALARAQAMAKLARTEAQRAERLLQSRAISSEEWEQRQAALTQAEADVRAAAADADVARLDLEFTEVRAPISGRAGRALVTAGNLVSSTTALTTLVSMDPVYVYFDGDQRNFQRFYQGSTSAQNPVRVGLAGEQGYPHQGFLDFIDNQVDTQTGTLRARAQVPNPQGILTPGLFARVQLMDQRTQQALLIDAKAVLNDQDRQYVFVVDEQGLAMRRDVQLGRRVDGLQAVADGLQAGDRLIVHGVQKVFFPGMPVNALDIAMGDAPASMGHAAAAHH